MKADDGIASAQLNLHGWRNAAHIRGVDEIIMQVRPMKLPTFLIHSSSALCL